MIKSCEVTTDQFPTDEMIINKPETVCAVSQILELLEKARELGCGKGTVCRDGIAQLYTIVRGIVNGRHAVQDLDLLTSLIRPLTIAADCEMSLEAIKKLSVSLDKHAEEWSGHVLRKRCPALVCPGYIKVYIDPETCNGCGQCRHEVPAGAIEGEDGLIHIVRDDTSLKLAIPTCPVDAFRKVSGVLPRLPESPVPVGSFSAKPKMRRRRRGGQ